MNKVSDDISKDLKDQPKFTTDIGEKDQDHHSFDLGEQTTLKKIQHFLHGNPTIVPVIILILSVIAFMDPELTKIVGLAWDCGAVTTGPVTVPLVLALGIGVAAAAGKGADSSLSGFGIVTLASVFPILGVLITKFLH